MQTMRLLALGIFCAAQVSAAEPGVPANLEPLPEAAPAPPEPVQSGESLEPDIRIIQKKDAIIEEYRVNGNLYMVKVIPAVGKPYYLLDQDGDGRMETNMSAIYSDFVVPQWVLFSW
ncbi:MAG: DUF2782 domain-containing protein [Gammaproteobacteria bacterium]